MTKRRNIQQNVARRIEANCKRTETARTEDEQPIKIIIRAQSEQLPIQAGPRVTLTLRVDS